jgi:hypothetical protein
VEVDVVSLAAEFPNDNPALHRGVIWVCTHPLAAPTAEAPQPIEPIEPIEVATSVAPVQVEAHADAEAEADAEADAEAEAEADAGVWPIHAVASLDSFEQLDPPDFEEPPSLFDELVAQAVPPRPSGIIAIPVEARLDTFEIEADAQDEDEDDVVIEELEPLLEAVVEGSTPPPADDEAEDEGEPEDEGEVAAAPPLESGTAMIEAANDVEPRATTLPPPPDDPFTVLLSTLADVAVAAGSPHVASLLPTLLLEGRLDHALPADAGAALAEANMVDGDGVSASFAKTLSAWRAILRGTSDDFDATGGVMLDEWAAELLARLLGTPAKAQTLRRELRSRGVAAFGLVEAA